MYFYFLEILRPPVLEDVYFHVRVISYFGVGIAKYLIKHILRGKSFILSHGFRVFTIDHAGEGVLEDSRSSQNGAEAL